MCVICMSLEIFMQRVKEVLLDDDKRKIYDETGEIPGEDGMGDLSGHHPLRTRRERQIDSETARQIKAHSLSTLTQANREGERKETEGAGGVELGARILFEGSLHMCGLV